MTTLRQTRATRSVIPDTDDNARDRSDRELAQYEPAFADAADTIFAAELVEFMSWLTHLVRMHGEAYVAQHLVLLAVTSLDFSSDLARWNDTFEPLIETVTAVGGDGVAAALEVDFNLREPRVIDAIVARAERLGRYVGETTRDQILTAVRDTVESGQGVNDLTTRMRFILGPEATRARAEMIARTEVHTAYATGAHLAALESGIAQSKTWLTVGDDRVRDSHSALDGVTIPIDAVFQNGCQYPGDPAGAPEETISCRCACRYSAKPAVNRTPEG